MLQFLLELQSSRFRLVSVWLAWQFGMCVFYSTIELFLSQYTGAFLCYSAGFLVLMPMYVNMSKCMCACITLLIEGDLQG